jgi:hypothetical protein
MVLYHCSLRGFEACSCEPVSRGIPSSPLQLRGARNSEPAEKVFRRIHAISGSLKINKLQAIENQKEIEFGVFRQSQQ